MEQVEQLILQAIKSFDADPADSDFQRGYLAAYTELAAALGIFVPISNDQIPGVSPQPNTSEK